MKKRRGKRLLIILFALLLIGIVAGCVFLGWVVFANSTQLSSPESSGAEQSAVYLASLGFDEAAFREANAITSFTLTSTLDGHIIPADHISCGADSGAIAILVHGLGGNRQTTYPMGEMFLAHGVDVLVYDQRSSGENTAPYTTFGYWESRDLLDCLTYAAEELAAEKIILWGTSFGGATVGIALGDEKAMALADCAILDCPVSSMTWLLEAVIEEMDTGLPTPLLLGLGSIANQLKLGFSYEEAEVSAYTSRSSVPTLVINSLADEITPAFMGQDIYDSLTLAGDRRILTVEDSPHGEIFFHERAAYEQAILDFCGLD